MGEFFLKKPYTGADGDDFLKEFIAYLSDSRNAISDRSMSDHALFLDGGKHAISEVIEVLKKEAGDE